MSAVHASTLAVRFALRSRLHRWLDDAVLILHVVGRRTGCHYDIPVGFVDLGDRLVVVTQHRWRRNLRCGGDLEVTRFGRRGWMHAELEEHPDPVARTIAEVLTRTGPEGLKRSFGIAIEAGGQPTHDDLSRAAREFDLAIITLTARPEQAGS